MVIESNAAEFFDSFARDFDSLYDGRRNFAMRWLDQHFRKDMFIRYAWTFDVLEPLAGKTVLDVGCGSGPYVVEALRRNASRVTALDPAPGMLELTKKRLQLAGLLDRCELVTGLFPKPNLEPHDHVMVMGVMDYVEDERSFIASLKPLVKISAAVSFPSRHWLRTPLRQIRYRLRNCPVFFYDERHIRTICESAGFRSVQIRKIPGAGMDYHVCLKP